jgi:hypothetical protein
LHLWWISTTAQLDSTRLPQGQALVNEVEQTYQETQNWGVDAFAGSLSNIGKPTPLQEYYQEKQQCIYMKRPIRP